MPRPPSHKTQNRYEWCFVGNFRRVKLAGIELGGEQICNVYCLNNLSSLGGLANSGYHVGDLSMR